MVSDQQARRLEDAVRSGDKVSAEAVLEGLRPQEMAHLFALMPARDSTRLLELLDSEDAADVVDHIPDSQAAELIEDVDPQTAAAILTELPAHEQADVIGAMHGREAEAVLSSMELGNAETVRSLAAHPEGTAGALMEVELLAFDQHITVAEVVSDLQSNAQRYRELEVQYLHVLSSGRLTGLVPLRELVLSEPSTSLLEIVIPDPTSVSVGASLEELVDTFDGVRFLSLPVVDEEGGLLGLVRRSSVEHALAAKAEGDYRKSLGIVGGEELRSLPYLTRSRRRLSWLSINVVLNVLAASVIALYQDTLAAVIALAAFLPIISDMSGCSGNQAVAVSMRELALGLVEPREAFRVLRKELILALMTGSVLGSLLGLVAWLWQGNIYLALVVGLALAGNTVIATSMGGVLPLVLQRLGRDPALASGPILTTVTDICGFFMTLALATYWLAHLM